MNLTYGSLFTGIGGFDLGFDRAGLQGMWQVERDKDCNRVLDKHWPGIQRGTDVREVVTSRFGAVNVICGGFPCQDVSVAGKRKGLAGERSGLWREFHRIVAEFKPRFCVIENVPGLFSSNGGIDFLVIIRGLEELGYSVAWAVLDSQYRGVAQRRDRVFVVGSLGNGSCAEILFEPESVRGDTAPSREKGQRTPAAVARCLRGRGNASHREDSDNYIAQVAPALTSRDAKGARMDIAEPALIAFDERVITSPGNRSEVETGKPCPTLNGGVGMSVAFSSKNFDKSHLNGGGQVAVAFTERSRTEGRTLESQEEVAYALTNPCSGSRTHNRQISQGMSVRRLTPRECERLQGFPDDWTRWDASGKEISDSARYRMLGNAVTATVAEWLGSQIVRNNS